jgi:hypothetical protein
MTRKLTRNSFLVALLTILIFVIAIVAPAQRTSSAPSSAQNAIASPQQNSSTSSPELELRPSPDSSAALAIRSQTTRHHARPLDETLPLFSPEVDYPSGGSSASSVAVADLNHDGKPDIVVAISGGGANGDGMVGVLLGNGNGTFQTAVTYDTGDTGSFSVAVADLNGDGKPDIAVANCSSACATGSVSILLGNGDGTFQPAVVYQTKGYQTRSVAVADLRSNGIMDLIATNLGGNVSVLLGNGDGTFQSAVLFSSGGAYPQMSAVTDVNGDGKPDIIVLNWFENVKRTPGTICALLGNGDGTFQSPVCYLTGGSESTSLAVADINDDGKPDVLATNWYDGTVGVLLGNGDGTFQAAADYAAGSGYDGPESVAVADVNADGKPDLVVTNGSYNNLAVLLGNGDGTFQPAVTYSTGSVYSIAITDVNGDGRPDLVVANGDGTVGVMLHVGTTQSTTKLASSPNPSVFGQSVTFTASVSSTSGTPTGSVALYEGSSMLGTGTLVNGIATIPVLTVPVGSNSITALYQGSVTYAPSLSAALNQVVTPATTSTSVASSLNPVPLKEYVTYTAKVTGQYGGLATGAATFQDSGVAFATVALTGNQAAYSINYKTVGAHAITVTYSGDANNTGSTSPVLTEQVIKGVRTKIVVTTSGSPSLAGQPVTFTATVTSTHGAIPDGELVTFYDGTTAIGAGATASGVVAFTTSLPTAKNDIIKATYPGDATFEPSTGSVKQVVDKNSTTTALSLYPDPGDTDAPEDFWVTVTSAGPTPTGTVKIMDGTRAIASQQLGGGTAYLNKKLTAGTHMITALYLGDAASVTSTSPMIDLYVYGH